LGESLRLLSCFFEHEISNPHTKGLNHRAGRDCPLTGILVSPVNQCLLGSEAETSKVLYMCVKSLGNRGCSMTRKVAVNVALCALVVFVAMLASAGVANAAATKCPGSETITLGTSPVIFAFTDDSPVTETCVITVTDRTFVGQPNGVVFLTVQSVNEVTGSIDDIMTFFNNSSGQATVCYSSEPNTKDCRPGGLGIIVGKACEQVETDFLDAVTGKHIRFSLTSDVLESEGPSDIYLVALDPPQKKHDRRAPRPVGRMGPLHN
jgi:hypothetical protein